MYDNCTVTLNLYRESKPRVAKPTRLAYFQVVSGKRVVLVRLFKKD